MHSIIAPFIKADLEILDNKIEIETPDVILGIIKTGYDSTHIKKEHISGVSFEKKLNILLLGLGGIFIFAAFSLLSPEEPSGAFILPLLIGSIFMIEATKHYVVISSSGEKVRFKIHRFEKAKAKAMVKEIKNWLG